MRRSSYDRIIEWNTRHGGDRRHSMNVNFQILKLNETIKSSEKIDPLYLDLVPIKLVTCLEVYLRGIIAELVDGNTSCFEREEKLVKSAKIDLTFAAHVNREELTIGDFVAHTVSLGNLDSVISVLDALLDGFHSKIKISHTRWIEEKDEWPLPPIIGNIDGLMATLARVYEVRNILAHELPAESVFSPSELPGYVETVRSFIEAIDWIVIEVLHGSLPRTQIAMNISAGESLQEQNELLARKVDEVEAYVGLEKGGLKRIQKVWEEFSDLQADLVASQVEGGTMHSMLWAGEKNLLVRDRIDQLDRIKKEWMNA